MDTTPKWFRPVALAALLWNLLGCFAYLTEVMLTPEGLAKMSAAQQALHVPRPTWAVAASAFAVWGGALGCLGLLLRKRWSNLPLLASLLGVIVQDVGLLTGPESRTGPPAIALQGLVLVVAVALVVLGRKAEARGWLVKAPGNPAVARVVT
jgi:hypothetical protein